MMSNMVYYPPHHPEELHHSRQWYRNDVLAGIASSVHEKVNAVAQSSPFLSSAPQTDIPCFDRREIEVAPHVLGQGAFSQVYSISRLHVSGNGSSSTGDNYSINKARKRSLAEQVASAHEGCAPSPYALKHLRGDLVGNRDDFESAAIDLCVEVLFLTRLNHPNIIKVRGLAKGWTSAFSQRHDGFFIVMDRLEPLDHRIHRWRDRLYRFPDAKQVSLSRKIHYAAQVAEAVSYLHDRRIIFRDLKPSNVGFKPDDTVQLFDFGLCRELPQGSSRQDETFLMSGVGTRRYMAPEILNSNMYNEKADCFSWAMVLVEMLTLNKPYPQYSSEQHAEFVCKRGERPVLVQYGVPPVLQSLLEQAWSQDVRQRLSMKAICYHLHALSSYSDEEMSQLTTTRNPGSSGQSFSGSMHTVKNDEPVEVTSDSSQEIYFEFPKHFQHLLQDCEILSEYSDMDSSMDLTLTTTASTTWQDSVSAFF